MTDRFERFTYAIFSIVHCWNHIAAEEMKKYDLKGAYALYLVALSNHEGDITAARLAEATHRDKADVSRALSAFLERGLVERTGGSYRAALSLTPLGEETCRQIKERAELALSLGGDGMTKEMRESLYDSLDIISENLEGLCEKGMPV